MSTSSIFQPLDVARTEIRLLDILSSSEFTAQILTRLRKVSLDDSIEFDALSWCWGDVPRSSIIKINDKDFQCSPNLEAALRHFRDPTTTKTLWVDATCINQQDLREKSTQITLMSRIYKEASTVKVWLGESIDGSDDAMQIIRQLQEKPTLVNFELYGAPLREENIESLCKLLERPWWERIWVIQEVALARHAVFCCGKASFDSTRLVETIYGTIYGLIADKDPFGHIDSSTIKDLAKRLWEAFQRMAPVLEMVDTVQKIRADDRPGINTVKAITALSRLKATDPRDKIYGCLGLLQGYPELLVPNYNHPVDVVYTIATWALIVYARCLLPLCFVRPRRTVEAEGEKVKFPSWSLNFAQDTSKEEELWTRFSCTGAWEPFATKLRFPFLETGAVSLDEIVSCHSMKPDWKTGNSWVESYRNMHSTWRAFFGLELDKSNHSAYVGGHSIENAFWRLVVNDTCYSIKEPSQRKRIDATKIRSFADWVRNPNSQGLSPEYPDWEKNKGAVDYCFSLSMASRNKNTYLFKTRKGYMGMSTGIPDLKVGDQIYFLDRGEVPWALRPIHDKIEGTVFEVISECYVHGVMDGEAFKPLPQQDSKAWKRHELRRKLFGGQTLDDSFPLPPWGRILLT